MTTLTTRLSDLSTRLGTEFKSIRTLVNANGADLSSLNTTAKSNLVAALNEIKAELDSLTAAQNSATNINDTTASTSSTYSSSKISDLVSSSIAAVTNGAPAALDTLKELADAIGDDANFASTVTSGLGNRVRFDASQTLTAAQQTQALANVGGVATAAIGTPDTDFVTIFNNALV